MGDTPYKFSSAATATATTTKRRPKLLFGKYELGDLLGCGAFAKVYHARDLRTGESVAVKAVSKRHVHESNMAAQVKLEVSIMRRLRHPHIIRLLEVLATKTKIYFVMEYAKGGELFAKVAKGGRFSENLSRRYFHQLISAVGYCHSHGVYHRDLKPGNLLLDENWTLKIADFGLSTVSGQTRLDGMLHTLCGTPAYVAPEILNKKGYDGAKVDIWSCGITLYVLSTGQLPFDDSNLIHLYKKIHKGEFRCPRWMSPELKRFLSRLLDTNPKTRITIDEIYDDPWFNKGPYQNEGMTKFNGIKDNGEDIRDNPSQFLNAFDLISFSPGFNLSGLFEEKEEEEKILERFLSAEEPKSILERIEGAARGINTPQKAKVERTKGDMGIRVEGQNGKFGLVIEVYKLTEKLAVVEVRKREKDVGPSHGFWEHKLRPRICHLFYQSCSD